MPASIPKNLTQDDLSRYFRDAASRQKLEAVGAEYETIGILARDGGAVPLAGPSGVDAVLERLSGSRGWAAERARGTVFLSRNGSVVSLEPGGQIEISTPPSVNVETTRDAAEAHFDELRRVGKELGILWISLGVHPIAPIASVDWVAKDRYLIMREHFLTKGRLAHWMMKMTASIQANFDYANEEDAAAKISLAARLSPIFAAMFANSCLVEGKLSGYKSFRSRIWRDTDADRSGLPPCLFKPDFKFEDWVEYALGVPMFFVETEGKLVPAGGLTFRDFLNHGFAGRRPALADWETHLSTLFPEVRLKKWIEIRSIDRQGGMLAYAVPAFMKTLLYVGCAHEGARKLVARLTRAECLEGLEQAARLGPEGALAGRKLADWAKDLYVVAQCCAESSAAVTDFEREAILSMSEMIQNGECPADRTIREFESGRSVLDIARDAAI